MPIELHAKFIILLDKLQKAQAGCLLALNFVLFPGLAVLFSGKVSRTVPCLEKNRFKNKLFSLIFP